MQLKILLVITGLVAIKAESPTRSGYAPAGWRPQLPFNLPNDFAPPAGSTVEITRAQVEHAGTFNEPQVNSNYLPPIRQEVLQPASNVNQGDYLTGEQPAAPAAQYGAPDFKINYPDEDESAASSDLKQTTKEGRYYIVSNDNKLQRVLYRTSEDQTGNGLTAQLRYTSVGELQDPVYRYNNQGQLERVLK